MYVNICIHIYIYGYIYIWIYIYIYTSKPGIFKDISVKTPIHLPQTKAVKLKLLKYRTVQERHGRYDLTNFRNSMRVVVSDTKMHHCAVCRMSQRRGKCLELEE